MTILQIRASNITQVLPEDLESDDQMSQILTVAPNRLHLVRNAIR